MTVQSPYDPPKSVVADLAPSASKTRSIGRVIRWILILPAAIAAWFVALILCILVLVSVGSLCVSKGSHGQCVEPWFGQVQNAILPFGAGLAAALIMITCTWLARTHKRLVAIATFVVGTIVAIMIGKDMIWGQLPMAAAIVSGAIFLAIFLRKHAPAASPDFRVR